MKKEFDFFKYRKPYLVVIGVLLILAIVLTIVLKVPVGIEFSGGTIMKYSFVGNIDTSEVEDLTREITGQVADVRINEDVQVAGGGVENQLSLSFSKQVALPTDVQNELTKALKENYADNSIDSLDSEAVDASMGSQFFWKCVVAMFLAALLIIIYVGFRFRKIGGITAAALSVASLFLDIFIAFLAALVFRFPVDSNFVAVVLTILGYSINDTIVVFDRIRENRRLMGPKVPLTEVVNKSMNQTIGRCVWTAACTFTAALLITIVALIYNMDTILSFSVPMVAGILGGSFSSIFFAPVTWAIWQSSIYNKQAEARDAARKNKKVAKAR